MLGVWHERIRQADHGLGRAEKHGPAGVERLCDASQHIRFRRRIEIDEDVAAEDDVESAEMAEALDQIQGPEGDHGADLRRDLPILPKLGEVLSRSWMGARAAPNWL